MSLMNILTIISFTFAFISFTAGFLFRRNIKTWTFWQSTGCVFGVALLVFAFVFPKTNEEFKLTYAAVFITIIMMGIMGQQKYGGPEKKDTSVITARKESIVKSLAFVSVAVSMMTCITRAFI